MNPISKLTALLILSLTLVSCSHSNLKNDRVVANDGETLVVTALPPEDDNNTSYTSLSESNRRGTIANCKGSVELTGTLGSYNLLIRNSTCSNLQTMYGSYKMEGTGSSGRYKNLRISDAPGWHKILVGGNKYMETNGQAGIGDVFYIFVAARSVTIDLRNTSETNRYNLPNCKGAVHGNIGGGQVNIVISKSNCTKFDILSNSGESLNYNAQDIKVQGTSFGGSFTLPPRFYDRGSNGVTLRIYTPYWTEDRVLVKFSAQ